jgi:hypothetical protein
MIHGSRRSRPLAEAVRALPAWALIAAAAWLADGGSALASPSVAPAPAAPSAASVHHAAAAPARTLVRPVRARRHVRVRKGHAPHADASRTLARAERRPAPSRPRDHGAPPPPTTPSQASLHRQGPDSRGQGVALPPAPPPRAAAGEAIARGEFGRVRAIGTAPVRGVRGPPARTAAGIARTRTLCFDRPAHPAPRSAPHLAAIHPATFTPPPAPVRGRTLVRTPDARAAAFPAASQEPLGSRTARPGGGAGAFHPPSAGESS